MWRVALRDLRWRRRRFVIAVLAAPHVRHDPAEWPGSAAPASTTRAGGSWPPSAPTRGWSPRGRPGRSPPRPRSRPPTPTGSPGCPAARADPLVILHSTVRRPAVRDVNVIGARPGGLGARPARAAPWPGPVRWSPTPSWAAPWRPAGAGRASARGRRAGQPGDLVFWDADAVLALEDAPAVAFGRQPLAMAVLTEGVPGAAPRAGAGVQRAGGRRPGAPAGPGLIDRPHQRPAVAGRGRDHRLDRALHLSVLERLREPPS